MGRRQDSATAVPGPRFWVGVARRLVLRPSLWPTAMVEVALLARPEWWRHSPFLPLPDPAYVRFRLETQYGSGAVGDRMHPGDVVEYLDWCRDMATEARRARPRR
jgi:hypothetical protein